MVLDDVDVLVLEQVNKKQVHFASLYSSFALRTCLQVFF